MIELSYFIERIHVVSHGMHRLGIKTFLDFLRECYSTQPTL